MNRRLSTHGPGGDTAPTANRRAGIPPSRYAAAAAVTTVLVGSQFGLAGHYNSEAGAVLAGQPAMGGVAMATGQRTAG